MSSDPRSAAERDRLLDRLKTRYEPGAMRPQLYQTASRETGQPDIFKFQWMFYAGMGEVDFHPAKPEEAKAAQELLESGAALAIPSSPFYYGFDLLERVKLLEDVQWGLTPGGEAIIFNLTDKPDGKDEVIKIDAYSPAIVELRQRLHYNRAFPDRPITLNDGTPVVPIQFEKQEAILRKRQDALTLQMS
jgi:hypothetical protein